MTPEALYDYLTSTDRVDGIEMLKRHMLPASPLHVAALKVARAALDLEDALRCDESQEEWQEQVTKAEKAHAAALAEFRKAGA